MTPSTLVVLTACVLFSSLVSARKTGSSFLTPGFRPPSVPLAVVDPYLSVWSNADHLYDDVPRHWSGAAVGLSGMILVDGVPFRFMGNQNELAPNVMQQFSVEVFPTQTMYKFQQAGVQLELTFSTPQMVTSRQSKIPDVGTVAPVTMLTFEVTNIDTVNHMVKIYYDNTAEGAVRNTNETVVWERDTTVPGFDLMRIGTEEQNYLGQTSDRINWGYWYVATPSTEGQGVTTSMANSTLARTSFMKGQPLPPDDKHQPRPCSDNWPVLAVEWDLGTVQVSATVIRRMSIIYDQIYSIRYFGTAMAPYWKSGGLGVSDLVKSLSYEQIELDCDALDLFLTEQLNTVGGSNYTTIASLAYRQAMGGLVYVTNNVTNTTWAFMKEISSDGDVSTVDVVFPSSPFFFWMGGNMNMRLLLEPLLAYANNNTAQYGIDIQYNLQWAPHHLGRWPVCDLSPILQEQMPMEETGNMLIMLAMANRNFDSKFLEPYWSLLNIWGEELAATLPDPGNQLCTDDFEGPSPHNVNLAAKGIVGLGAYAYLLREHGQGDLADHYDELIKNFVQYWLSKGMDPDHYKRQFNLTNSWSLKYNLLYQSVLGLDLFPDSVIETEEQFYQTKMNKYGIPLDDRADFAKADWLMWVAAMGTEQQFQAITNAVYKFANETPDRTPFTDWYYTTTGKQRGFTARPVIGGLYARMMLKWQPSAV